MKKMLMIMFAMLCLGNSAHAALFAPGDSATLSFSSLPYIGTTTEMDGSLFQFPSGTGLKDGDSLKVDVYDNKRNLQPLYSVTYNGPSMFIFGVMSGRTPLNGNPNPGYLVWEDLEGKLILTMLSGSMNINSLDVKVYSGGQAWGNTLAVTDVTPTPIPAAAWLLGSGLMSLAELRRRRV